MLCCCQWNRCSSHCALLPSSLSATERCKCYIASVCPVIRLQTHWLWAVNKATTTCTRTFSYTASGQYNPHAQRDAKRVYCHFLCRWHNKLLLNNTARNLQTCSSFCWDVVRLRTRNPVHFIQSGQQSDKEAVLSFWFLYLLFPSVV